MPGDQFTYLRRGSIAQLLGKVQISDAKLPIAVVRDGEVAQSPLSVTVCPPNSPGEPTCLDMGTVEILIGVVFVLLVGACIGLTPAASLPWEFFACRAGFAIAAVAAAAGFVSWARKKMRAPLFSRVAIVLVGFIALMIITCGTPLSFYWVSVREQRANEQQRAQREAADTNKIITLLNRQAETDANARAVRDAIIVQWQHIQKALTILEQTDRHARSEERALAAAHILSELEVVRRIVGIIPFAQGAGLVLQIAPNTFRVTFPEPMRRVPDPIIHDAPSGAKPQVLEITTIGCTVIFMPMEASVTLQDFLSLHPAFSADL